MARSHAKLLTNIWANEDFVALDDTAQRVYILALSQPNISYAGVVPFTSKRWAQFASNTTKQTIVKAVARLVKSRFVQIDENTEELLVRSFPKHDGVLESPNLIRAMARDFSSIVSRTLREGFLEGLPEGCEEGFPKGLPEPFLKGLANRYGMGDETVSLACARSARSPSPYPYPSPRPGANPSANGPDSDANNEEATKRRGQPQDADPLAERIIEHLGDNPRIRQAATQLVTHARNHLDARDIDTAIGLAIANNGRTVAYIDTAIRDQANRHGITIPRRSTQ